MGDRRVATQSLGGEQRLQERHSELNMFTVLNRFTLGQDERAIVGLRYDLCAMGGRGQRDLHKCC